MATFTVERTARKPRRCSDGYCRTIRPGERYLLHTVTPHDSDLGNGDAWWHVAECCDCAERNGRPIDGAITRQIAHRDHRLLVQVAPNTWTGPVDHGRACPCPAEVA